MVRFTPNGLSVSVAAALDLLAQLVRRRLGQRGDEAERAGVGDRGDQFGAADPLHAALHDRVLDAEHFGEARLDHDLPSVSPARRTARSFFEISGGRMTSCPAKVYRARAPLKQRDHAKTGLLFRAMGNSDWCPAFPRSPAKRTCCGRRPRCRSRSGRRAAGSCRCEIPLTSCCAVKIMSDIGIALAFGAARRTVRTTRVAGSMPPEVTTGPNGRGFFNSPWPAPIAERDAVENVGRGDVVDAGMAEDEFMRVDLDRPAVFQSPAASRSCARRRPRRRRCASRRRRRNVTPSFSAIACGLGHHRVRAAARVAGNRRQMYVERRMGQRADRIEAEVAPASARSRRGCAVDTGALQAGVADQCRPERRGAASCRRAGSPSGKRSPSIMAGPTPGLADVRRRDRRRSRSRAAADARSTGCPDRPSRGGEFARHRRRP